MLRDTWQRLIEPADSLSNPNERRLSRLLASWLLATFLVVILLFLVRLPFGLAFGPELWARLIIGIVTFVLYFLNRTGHYKAASSAAATSGSLVIYILAIVEGGPAGPQILNYLAVMILFASLFLSSGGIIVVFLAQLVGMLCFPYFALNTTFIDVVGGPISLNLTLAAIMFLIAQHRNQLERARQARLTQERTAFHIMATAAVAAQDIPTLCQLVLSGLVKILKFDMGVVRLYDEDKQILPLAAIVGMETSEANDILPPQTLDDEQYLAAYVANNRQPIFAPHVSKHPFLPVHKARLKELRARAFISYPLINAQGRLLGVINLAAHRPKELAASDQGIFTTIAEMFAAALEHKRAEEAVHTSEARFRQLAYSLPDTVYILDRATSTLEFMNRDTFLGYTQSELVSPESIMQALHPDDLTKVSTFWANLIQDKPHTPREIEYRLKRKEGGWEWISNRAIILSHDSQGAPQKLLVVLSSVTARKQLLEAQKTESLGILAGGIAHDFNNLLVAMLGQASLALAKMSPESPAFPHVNKTVDAAERAATLTRQLLAYSGRGQFEIHPINLNALIEENLHLFQVAVPKQIHLQSILASSLPYIEADMGQMQQVVMNLVLNAAEAIGEQEGIVTVVTGVQDIGPDDHRYWKHSATPLISGNYVTLEVRDNGRGMDGQTLSKIFNPFFTTKTTGRGLGLAAVLGIVRGHKGGLSVYSKVGEGTTFKLLFPALTSENMPEEIEHKNPVEKVLNCVLVIDDEAAVREAVKDILELENIQVVSAPNGADGIALYRQQAPTIDLVLLDLSMPGLSGEETLRALRQFDPEVRVIISSGYSEVEAARRFTGRKPAGFLQKPYSATALLEAVKRHVRHA